MNDETPGIGHNLSPEELEYEKLADRTGDLVDNANRWKTERPEIKNDEQATSAKEFIDQLLAAEKDVEARRLKTNKPHKEAIAAIDKQHKALTALLRKSIEMMRALLTPYALEKQRQADEERLRLEDEARKQREAAEEAARKAAEGGSIQDQVVAEDLAKAAEKAEKGAAAPARAKIEGSTGKAASVRTTYFGIIEDFEACLQHFKERPQILETLRKLVDAEVRAKNHNIPGVKIDSKASVI